ncbi:MAG TPA: 5-oxoprolinase subunit PxpA [Candidatus Polarisedimenticolaceae bacterium]|nr:5-oxoprolinase subunit PxpA [Candidatus Polarisedimenticolaceae bacterium]
MTTIDLNADVGEGADDDALYPLLSSINVACGGHAGDERSMTAAVESALTHGLALGAHPSYPDTDRFGRVSIAMAHDALADVIASQLAALAEIAEARGAPLRHVKPHGALYNDAARDPAIAAAIADGVARVDHSLLLFGLAGSTAIAVWRDLGWRCAEEGFCDRGYERDGSLVARSKPGALLTDPGDASAQAVRLASEGRCRTLCVHSDTPGAAAILAVVRKELTAAGFGITPP